MNWESVKIKYNNRFITKHRNYNYDTIVFLYDSKYNITIGEIEFDIHRQIENYLIKMRNDTINQILS